MTDDDRIAKYEKVIQKAQELYNKMSPEEQHFLKSGKKVKDILRISQFKLKKLKFKKDGFNRKST